MQLERARVEAAAVHSRWIPRVGALLLLRTPPEHFLVSCASLKKLYRSPTARRQLVTRGAESPLSHYWTESGMFVREAEHQRRSNLKKEKQTVAFNVETVGRRELRRGVMTDKIYKFY